MTRLNKVQLLSQIESLGYQLDRLDDLMKLGKKDRVLVPILMEHIKNIDNEDDKILLVRSLGVKGFHEVSSLLLEEFHHAHGELYKWVIGNTLEIIQDKNTLPDLIKIVSDKSHGASRKMMVIAIGKMGGPREVPVLIRLLQDEQVLGHALAAIGYLKDPELIPYIEPFLTHQKTYFRNEAKKALKKLEKVLEKSQGTIH